MAFSISSKALNPAASGCVQCGNLNDSGQYDCLQLRQKSSPYRLVLVMLSGAHESHSSAATIFGAQSKHPEDV